MALLPILPRPGHGNQRRERKFQVAPAPHPVHANLCQFPCLRTPSHPLPHDPHQTTQLRGEGEGDSVSLTSRCTPFPATRVGNGNLSLPSNPTTSHLPPGEISRSHDPPMTEASMVHRCRSPGRRRLHTLLYLSASRIPSGMLLAMMPIPVCSVLLQGQGVSACGGDTLYVRRSGLVNGS